MFGKKVSYLALALVLVASILLAACGPAEEATQAPEPTAAGAEPTAAEPQPTAAEPTGGELEIFSWWTAGGEADGLNAMYEVFSSDYPQVEIINATVAGGAGSNAKAVLATRMQAGDPPDSFQVHAGHELIDS
ncbi:MAG: carbohydrate ABC transporter substrate-binding protein, partial [Anaerolineae bacterium]